MTLEAFLVFLGIGLCLAVLVVLAVWAVIVGRNRGLFGDAPDDDYPISRHDKGDWRQ